MDIALTTDFRSIPINRDSVKGLCLKGFEHLDVTSIPFDEPPENNREIFKLMKSTRSRCTVCFDFTSNGSTYRVYVKRYRTWRWLRKIGYFFVPSKAMREWRLGHKLLEKGIKTPLPVVAANLKCGPFIKENYHRFRHPVFQAHIYASLIATLLAFIHGVPLLIGDLAMVISGAIAGFSMLVLSASGYIMWRKQKPFWSNRESRQAIRWMHRQWLFTGLTVLGLFLHLVILED